MPPTSGHIDVRELDWTVCPDLWNWNHTSVTASSALPQVENNDFVNPPFDLICSADTVYIPSLVEPLLRTLHALCTLSLSSGRVPPIYLCVERRDPTVIDRVLSDATNIWGFTVDRVPHRKLVKAMDKAGIDWDRNEWDDIEIWKFTFSHKVS